MPYGESFDITQGLFLKSLGIIYLIAFISLLSQVKGLYGEKGIEPISSRMEELRMFSKQPFWMRHPTIFWFIYSDSALLAACWIGIAASLGVMFGFLTAVNLAIAWVIYLSFVNVGYPFLSFQWDILLIETGIIAIFYALLSPAPPIFIWALWLLIFRFMFASGYTKWAFGSKEWKNFTAMDYHYETQPLPTRLAYYLHHQPKWMSTGSVWATYFIELLVPFLIFTPESIRIYIFALLVLFQLIVIASGNFAFFNLLTIVLCLPLLSDPYITFLGPYVAITPLLPEGMITWTVTYLIGACLFFINGLALVANLYPHKSLRKGLDYFRGILIGNTYGLFVHMTTNRYEITIEGSRDGVEWKEYVFRYKPGKPQRPPKIVAPHQPRLDWQMWFAALGTYRQNPWFSHFVVCLLKQSPEVLKLLESNPFPNDPPNFIRCRMFHYTFTTPQEKKETGLWWKMDEMGDYTPIYTLNTSKQ